jgi:hypothetical protein
VAGICEKGKDVLGTEVWTHFHTHPLEEHVGVSNSGFSALKLQHERCFKHRGSVGRWNGGGFTVIAI